MAVNRILNVEIEVNTDCNRNCSYCPVSLDTNRSHKEMAQEVFLKIISELKKIQFRGRICYHLYGEPLLLSHLEKYVKFVNNLLPEATSVLFTNGILLTQKRFLSLVEAGIKFFIITKHEGVEHLMIEDFINHLDEKLKKRILIRHHTELNKTNRGGTLSIPSSQSVSLPLNLACRIPMYSVFFDVHGDVLLCHEDYRKSSRLGNIMDNDLMNLRNSSKFKSICQELNKGLRVCTPLCSQCSSTEIFPL